MKPSSPGLRRLLQAVSLLTMAGVGPAGAQTPASVPAPSALPAVPFDARVTRDAELFRKAKPENEDVALLSPGHVLTVSKLEAEQMWKGETGLVVAVSPFPQSTYYTLLSRLEPLGPAAVISGTEAGALLFQKVPEADRAWCQRFAGRVLLPASAGAGKAGALLYSASSDDACAGYMALVSGTGKAAKARALARRSAILSVAVHEVPGGGPPLLDVTEALRGKGISGSRRTLLSLERSGPRELLAVELATDRLERDSRHSVASTVTLSPSGNGLELEVRRTETRAVLATGAETLLGESVKRYRYAGGKLKALPDTAKPAEAAAPAAPKP
jgi:hypothetical protein